MEPTIVERPEQPYVSITARVPMTKLGEQVPPLNGEVFGWLAEHGIESAGPPIWKYNVIDMAGEIEIEVGVPVDGHPADDGRVRLHLLPAGRYAVGWHVGHPDTLVDATRELLDWVAGQGLAFDVAEVAGDERWTARYEECLTDPADQPDLSKWQTNLVLKLAD